MIGRRTGEDMKRAILLILDSAGIGELPDADRYGDVGSNTIANIAKAIGGLKMPNMEGLGLGNIHPIQGVDKSQTPAGAWGKAAEASVGKDTVTGHWEIAGCILKNPLNTYPNGFPREIIGEFERRIGRPTIGNTVASGTEIIAQLGEEHMKTGYPIIYTSADSVFQIAAHEGIIPIEEQYRMCQIARDMLVGEWTVGRVIARPFVGDSSQTFKRTSNRHDYSLDPFCKTILEYIAEAGLSVSGVGKIKDIFNGKGVTRSVRITDNMDGIDKTLEAMKLDEGGLLFINLVDFDMLFGHRNDPQGYGRALEDVDKRLGEVFLAMGDEDMLIITADHGCDPTTVSTDHSREYIPILVYGKGIKPVDIGIRDTFADIGKTILDYLSVDNEMDGNSFLQRMV